MRLRFTTQASDLDVFVYVEEVTPDGSSTYVTEGNLRASHRALGNAPYDTLGLPFHTHRSQDALSVRAGDPVDLVAGLLPTSYRFRAGNRLRVVVTFADADNFDTPVLVPAPEVELRTPSCIELPLVERSGDRAGITHRKLSPHDSSSW